MRINLIQSSKARKGQRSFMQLIKPWLPTAQTFRWRSFSLGLLAGLIVALGAAVASASGTTAEREQTDQEAYSEMKSRYGFSNTSPDQDKSVLLSYLNAIKSGQVSRYDTSRVETEYCMTRRSSGDLVTIPRKVEGREMAAFCQVLYYSRKSAGSFLGDSVRSELEQNLKASFGQDFKIKDLIAGHDSYVAPSQKADRVTEIRMEAGEGQSSGDGAERPDTRTATSIAPQGSPAIPSEQLHAGDVQPAAKAGRSLSKMDPCPEQSSKRFDQEGYRVTCLKTCGEERIYQVEKIDGEGKLTSRILRESTSRSVDLELAKSAFGIWAKDPGDASVKPYHMLASVKMECEVTGQEGVKWARDMQSLKFLEAMRERVQCEQGQTFAAQSSRDVRFSTIRASQRSKEPKSESKEYISAAQCNSGAKYPITAAFKPEVHGVTAARPPASVLMHPKENKIRVSAVGGGVFMCRSTDLSAIEFAESVIVPTLSACELPVVLGNTRELKRGSTTEELRRAIMGEQLVAE